MPTGRGRSRGGNNQARGRARGGGSGQNNTRDRRYNVRDVCQGTASGDNSSQPPLQGQVAEPPMQSLDGLQNNSTLKQGATRNRRPAANVDSADSDVKKVIKKNPSKVPPAKEDDDPDYLFRSKIPVKDAKYGHGVRYNPKDPNEMIPVTKIYVTSIGNAVEADLLKCFTQYGPITDVTIKLKDLYGYAFITFTHHKDALKALSSESKIGNRKLVVKEALQTHQPMPIHIDKLAAITAPDACYIKKLNDDCLRHIFSYLNLVERTQVEVVCKCWLRLSREMWLIVRSLDFTTQPLSTYLHEGTVEYDQVAKQLTSLTGHNLTSLTINRFNTQDTLRTIHSNCSALERLTMSHFKLYDNKAVIPSIKSLKHLSMENCAFSDKVLTKIFSIAKSLESVSVSHQDQETGTRFIEILDRMKSLSLGSSDVTHAHFTKFLARNGPTLKRLSLFKCRLDEEMYENAVELIVKHAPNLEELTLNKFYRASENLRLNSLYKLSALRSLSLCLNNGLNSDILLKIGRNCRALESLSLDCSAGLSSESIAGLGKLPRLSSLSLCHIQETNGLKNEAIIGLVNNLASPTQLRHFHLANTSLSDEALYAVLSLCVALETLDLSMCRRVTEATLMVAEDAVASRTSPPLYLTLNIDGTPIQSAVLAAAESGKRFNPRLLFRASKTALPKDLNIMDLSLVESDDADSNYSGDDGAGLLDALNLVDSDEEYMYLMGLGIDPLDFDDFLGYRLGHLELDRDDDDDDDDPYDGSDFDPDDYFPA